ncbi:hypothetical protein [Nostoc sp. FACHB-190]|uniref:hypothetical protein n=1 Tax=Nostoc sp. FACHB-190 TaxID=2692838 RepID=UPI0016828C80|nr:hypothetical protein [Nostoc sp. FACHB-190]MBD2303217.1 hypothetical protein [Nostoc sp. FACHB-190]
MTFNQEGELAYLAEIQERVKRGWLEICSYSIFGPPYALCKNCDACIHIICTDSPGDRLDSGDPKQAVNCPKCSAFLGKFLSATRPVTLVISKEEFEKNRIDWSEIYAGIYEDEPECIQPMRRINFEDEYDIPF